MLDVIAIVSVAILAGVGGVATLSLAVNTWREWRGLPAPVDGLEEHTRIDAATHDALATALEAHAGRLEELERLTIDHAQALEALGAEVGR